MQPDTIADFHHLVERIRDFTASPLPEMLDANAPVLSADTLREASENFYIVGLIGGKNVGKSALVNAIVGEHITVPSSTGCGTDRVIAYVHESRTDAVTQLLDSEVPGQYAIVLHTRSDLSRQVLCDLPDFDSHFASHVEITRRMLRHMLYPIWVQSIEKYADHQPRELLRQVMAGNDPGNLLFCLNKLDQLDAQGDPKSAQEIRDDFGRRIADTLGLAGPAHVWLVSALHPDRYELPRLRETLDRQRGEETVARSRSLAASTHVKSLVNWIARQQLPERLERVLRLEEQAQEAVLSQVVVPVLETALPGISSDAAWTASVADSAMRRRISRWPLLNMLHLVLEPVLAALRGRIIPTQRTLEASGREVVASHFQRLTHPLSLRLASTFARLQQSSPLMSRLYAGARPWEQMIADQQVGALQQRCADVLDARATQVGEQFARDNPIAAFLRFMLTIGAAVWFVIAQPVLQLFVDDHRWTRLLVVIVQIFSVAFLLKSIVFMAAYFAVLWLMVRWRTQREVEKRLRQPSRRELALNDLLSGAVLEWTQGLLSPIRQTREQLESFIAEADRLSASPRLAA